MTNAVARQDRIARPPATVDESEISVMLWHWGRVGAGARFTFELVRELRHVPGMITTVSASANSELEKLAMTLEDVPVRTVRTFRGEKSSIAGLLGAGLGVLRLPAISAGFSRSLREASSEVALCTMQSIWDVAALPSLSRGAARFLLVLHDAKIHPGDAYPFRERILTRQVMAADALIVLSDHVAKMARDLHEFPADRIWIIPHGAFTFGSAPALPRKHPEGRPFRLLFFGRIVAYKGLGHLLEAYRILRRRGVAVDLEIIGSGNLAPYRAALERLPGAVVHNAWVDDDEIGRAFARSDILALPYLEASQSGVAAAAAAAGLPMVATPVGGLVEQVDDGVTGLVAAGMSAEDLADAVATLVDSRRLYEACSAGCLRAAAGDLAWSRLAERVAAIVREVRDRPPRWAQ